MTSSGIFYLSNLISMFEDNKLVQKIASDSIINEAYEWLCERRKDYSPNNDIWDFRFYWVDIKCIIQESLLTGDYSFCALKEIRFPEKKIEMWSSQDALVLKAIAIVLGEYFKPILSNRCFHIKGNGGAKKAVRETLKKLSPNDHVMKSDIKGYYANMDHEILFDLIKQYIPDRKVRSFLYQYLKRTVCFGEIYKDCNRGISLGCPLSPLMGALYLKPLDDKMEKLGLFYARFMDDWVVIAPTRWKLREAVRIVNEILNKLRVEKHPDKTFIGKVAKGFDFLGYFLKPRCFYVAKTTIAKFLERIVQLYEQSADLHRIGQYIRNWLRWVRGGISKGALAPLYPPFKKVKK